MVLTILNILLVVLSAVTAVAAIGGETWRKGDEPVLSRITVRGWISIGCAIIAFASGASKQVIEDKLTAAARAEQLESRTQLAKQAISYAADVKHLNEHLGEARNKLEELQETNANLEMILGDLGKGVEGTKVEVDAKTRLILTQLDQTKSDLGKCVDSAFLRAEVVTKAQTESPRDSARRRLRELAAAYSFIRMTRPGPHRTSTMWTVVNEAEKLVPTAELAESDIEARLRAAPMYGKRELSGDRLVGIVAIRAQHATDLLPRLFELLSDSYSEFEQFQTLVSIDSILQGFPKARQGSIQKLSEALAKQTIRQTGTDRSRVDLANNIIAKWRAA